MHNPWKSRSQINPQREEGTRQISNEVYRALMRAPLTIGELKIALCIIDKTWGFNKATDMISVGQIAMATNLSDRGVRKTIVALKEKRIIHYAVSKTRVNSGSPLNEFLFNKHYDTWRSEGCTVVQGVNKSAAKGEQEGSLRVNSGSSTKETLTKETSTKEIGPAKNSSKKKASKKKSKTSPPDIDNFEPTKSTVNLCKELGIMQGKFKILAASCFDHFAGKGEDRADWNATVRNWIRKDQEYNPSSSSGDANDPTRGAL